MDNYDSHFNTSKITNDNKIDNSLLNSDKVPVDKDNYYDSTTNFIDITNPNGISEAEKKLNKDFDLGKFNIVFENNKKIVQEYQRLKELEKLNAMTQKQEIVSLYNLNIYQILVNTKDTWFDLLDDILDRKYTLSIFHKDNRLFYIGITILFFSIVLYMYSIISDNNKLYDNNK